MQTRTIFLLKIARDKRGRSSRPAPAWQSTRGRGQHYLGRDAKSVIQRERVGLGRYEGPGEGRARKLRGSGRSEKRERGDENTRGEVGGGVGGGIVSSVSPVSQEEGWTLDGDIQGGEGCVWGGRALIGLLQYPEWPAIDF